MYIHVHAMLVYMFRMDILEVMMDDNFPLPPQTKVIQPTKSILINPHPQCTKKKKKNPQLNLCPPLVVAMVTVQVILMKRVRPVLATRMWSMAVRPSLPGMNKMVDIRMNCETGPLKALIMWREENKELTLTMAICYKENSVTTTILSRRKSPV